MVHFNKILCFFALLFILQVTSKDIKATIFHRRMIFFGNKTDMGVPKNVTDGEYTLTDGKTKWFKQNGFGGSFDHNMTGEHPRNTFDNKKDPSCCDQYCDVEIDPNNGFDVTVGQLDQCCDFCSGITGCKAWVWKNGSCYFYSATGPGITSIGAITGIPCGDRPKETD